MKKPKKMYSKNPVVRLEIEPNEYMIEQGYVGPGWYFWDETWTQLYGPFDGQQDATIACAKYAETL